MKDSQTKLLPLVRGGAIAALYVVLTVPLGQIGFGIPLGPIMVQFRPAEALTMLPILFPEAIPAVFIGVLLSNLISQFGWIDVIFGSLITLAAALVTRWTRRTIAAWLSPILFNAFLISIYVAWFMTNQWGTAAYWTVYFQQALSIGLSQALVVFGLGLPLIAYIRKAFFREY